MLQGQSSQKGLTVVPIKLYTKKGIIKLEIALAKGKNYLINDRMKREKTGIDKKID